MNELPFAQMENLDVDRESLDNTKLNTNDLQASKHDEDSVMKQLLQDRKSNPRGALLLHLNINSIQNKFEEFKMLNDKLKSHIIFISETKIDKSYPNNQFNLPDYHMYRRDRKKGGGGLLAYFSTSIPSKELKLPKVYKTLEVLAIESKVGRNELIFLGMYRPPKQSDGLSDPGHLERVEEELNDICLWASLQKQTVVITGDLNLNRLRPQQKEGRILRDLEEIHNLTCMITEPTRITPISETLIDVILTNNPELFCKSGAFNPEISDHHMIYGIMNENVHRYRPKVISFRSDKNTDLEKFNEDIKNAPWQAGDSFDTVDDQYEYWKTLLDNIIDEHLPEKKMRVRERDVPYMNTQWKNAIRQKRKYAKIYASNRSQENLLLKKKWRNAATKERRKAIKAYWLQTSENLKNKPREFYKTFRPFISDKCKDSNAISIRINGRDERDQARVAEELANYFSTMANSIGGINVNDLEEHDFENHPSVNIIKKEHDQNSHFNFKQFKVKEVQRALEKIDTKKATGWDSISPKVLKMAAKGIAPSLTSIFNKCILQSQWPTAWKKGEWVPVFKKGDRQICNNYRPITILLSVDKVFEKLLSNQITEYYNPKMYNRITAYRKTHSCETTLLRLVEDWKQEIDKKECVAVLSTDMSKAFDALHPALLIKKLKAYGFSDTALSLMRNFFSCRMNRVKIGGEVSSWKKIIRGCPQGSSFGPLLWNLFQNDMPLSIKNSNLSMYADDHQIYAMGQHISNVMEQLKKEAELASTWYSNNLLLANPEKYQILTLTPRQHVNNANEELTINLEGNEIKSSKSLNLLGVNIDDALNFSEHISNVCKKASQKVGVIMRLRNLIPTHAKLQLYKSAILPHLTYCHLVWHFCKASDRKKLERVQERALRVVYNNKTSTYEQLLELANLPSLHNRRLQDIAILMYKVKNNLSPSNISDIFNTTDKGYALRNADFHLPRWNTVKYGKHSIRYFGPHLWSKLSYSDKQHTTIGSFKKSIRAKDLSSLLNC